MPQRIIPVRFLLLGLSIGTMTYIAHYLTGLGAVGYTAFWTGFILLLGLGCYGLGVLVQQLYLGVYTDPLTRQWNRRYFYRKLAQELKRCKADRSLLCLAMIDLDNFKRVNDLYGHHTGDKVMLRIVNIFRRETSATDTIIRWGGDEFAILIPGSDLKAATVKLERIRKRIADSSNLHGVTISASVVEFHQGSAVQAVLMQADCSLYKAKAVKNKIVS